MKKFEKPRYETIYFVNNVIATSACGCYDGVTNWGTDSSCSKNDPTCTCQVNHDPTVANCIDP